MDHKFVWKLFKNKFPDIAERSTRYTNKGKSTIEIYTNKEVYIFKVISNSEYQLYGRY